VPLLHIDNPSFNLGIMLNSHSLLCLLRVAKLIILPLHVLLSQTEQLFLNQVVARSLLALPRYTMRPSNLTLAVLSAVS
jgi:hypothetical protein